MTDVAVQRARWAAGGLAALGAAEVQRICDAVAETAHQHAERLAEAEVRERGAGIVEDTAARNERNARGLLERHRFEDFVSPRVDAERRTVELPHPLGVVLASLPASGTVAALYAAVLGCLMTRNAVIVVAGAGVPACAGEAGRLLAVAAEAAGAPDGSVQIAAHEEGLDGADLVLLLGNATGSVPVLVDATADPAHVARVVIASKTFDHSLAAASESVVIVEEPSAGALERAFAAEGGQLCDAGETARLREALREPAGLAGRDVGVLARRAGIALDPGTRVLLAPFPLVVPEEPLLAAAHLPVLALVRVADVASGIDAARAVRRLGGACAAAIHSTDWATIIAFGSALPVPRIVANAGCWPAPPGEGVRPCDLVRMTEIAQVPDDVELGG